MVREGFDLSLQELKDDVILMMDKVEEILIASVQALLEQDTKKAKATIDLDDVIDEMQWDIEERCVELMALQQPAARDLRILFSILSIINELERMGDYSVNICKEVILIGDEEFIKTIKDIPRMKDIIVEMIQSCKEAFLTENTKMAYKIGQNDELVDELYRKIYTKLLQRISEDASVIVQGTRLLFIGRYLERTADHLTNICEKIIYISEGKRVEIN